MLLCGFIFELTFARNPRDAESAFLLAAKAYTLIIVAELALFFLYRRLSDFLYLGPGLKRIRTKVPDDRAVPVHVRITQAGVVTGCDEGYMWIEDGTIFFKGLQSVFRLNSADVIPLREFPRKHRPNPDHGRHPRVLYLTSDWQQVALEIDLIDPFEDFNTRRRAHFFHLELMEWLVQRPAGSLETLLPPLQVHPGLHRADFSSVELVSAAGALTAINAILVFTARLDSRLNTVPSILAALFLVVNIVLLVRAVRFGIQVLRTQKIRNALVAMET